MIRSEQIAKLKEELALHEQTQAAYAAWQRDHGVQLQFKWSHAPLKEWRDMDRFPEFSPLLNCHYRIKPTPKLRPWTKDEARGKWVRPKANPMAELMITQFHCDKSQIVVPTFGDFTVSFEELLQSFEQLDGSPCGVQE